MASPSEILGLFTSPQQYQAQQQDVARARAMEYAKLTPIQRAETAIGQGAYNLAGAIGGALGGQDPQLRKIAMRQQLASQLDQSKPDSFMQVAKLAAQNGDPEFAIAIAQEGRKVEESLAAINLKKSQADKNAAWKQTQTDSFQKRQVISSLEEKLATDPTYKPSNDELAKARWIIANESKPKSMIDQTTGQLMVIEGLDVNAAAPNLANYLKQAGVSVSAAQPTTAEATGVTTAPVATPTTPTGTALQAPAMIQIAPGIKAIPTPASAIKSKEEADKQAVKAEEEQQAVESFDAGISSVKELRKTISETNKLVGPQTTKWGSYLSVIPGSDAMTLDDNTKTIKDNIALAKLKELKQDSKTGASGLGALNMKEFDAIQGVIARLNPKSSNYPKDLAKIDDFFARAESLMTQQKSRAVGKVEKRAGATPTPQPSKSSDEAKIKRFIEFNGGAPKREDAIRALKSAGLIK